MVLYYLVRPQLSYQGPNLQSNSLDQYFYHRLYFPNTEIFKSLQKADIWKNKDKLRLFLEIKNFSSMSIKNNSIITVSFVNL